jgi:hypothetical protein
MNHWHSHYDATYAKSKSQAKDRVQLGKPIIIKWPVATPESRVSTAYVEDDPEQSSFVSHTTPRFFSR